MIQEIEGSKYLIVGTSREVRDEYVVSLDLLEREALMSEYLAWKKAMGFE